MFQIYEDTFLYGGQHMDVKDQFQGQHYTVKLTVDGPAETVLPNLTGYMTGPRSQISKKLGKSGVILIPSGTAGRFAERRHRYCLQREAYQLKNWIIHHGAAQGGILHGEIEPGKQMGWYVVLMMQLPRFGGYIDYAEPGYRFLGETNLSVTRFAVNEAQTAFTIMGSSFSSQLFISIYRYTWFNFLALR